MGNETFPLLYSFCFYFFGLVAVAAAVAFVTRRSPVAAAMWLVVTMFCLAALYVMMDAQFIGVMQVLVYAGAIMVVFVFVVMLLNLGHPSELSDIRGKRGRLLAGFLGLAMLAEIMALTRSPMDLRLVVPATPPSVGSTGGIIGGVSGPLFREYLLAFELTSVLLLIAIAGAVVLGRKRSPQLMLVEALALSAVLFTIGVIGVLTRRNAIIVFMCVELMLNAVNLSFVAFSKMYGATGQVFVVFVMTVAAAEAAVGLAIIISIFRHQESVNLKDINLLRG